MVVAVGAVRVAVAHFFAGGGARFGHFHVGIGARGRKSTVGRNEVHQFVLGCPAGGHGGIPLGGTFDHHLLHPTDPGPMAMIGRSLDHHPEAFETFGNDLGIDEPVLHGRRPGPGPGAEDCP